MDKIDILSREKFVEQLITITENIANSKKSTSFAINGIWGSGKSFVLDMFEEQLGQIQSEKTNSDKYFIIRYNCWEYDYYEEPLVAIVATMLDTIEKKTHILNGENSEKVKGILRAVGTTLLSAASGTIKSTTGIDLAEAYKIVSSGISVGKEEYEKSNNYDKYFSFKKALKSLHEVLNELSENYTVVFLIDELDRCLPEYAIKVLERLHHVIEGTHNVIHITSIDKDHLHKSVQHIFGFNSAEEYLKKFIQFTISLDVGKISEKFMDKHADYVELFDKNIIQYEDSIEDFIQQIFSKIEVRDQEHLIDKIMLTHKILFSNRKDYSFMCIELLIGVMLSHYGNITKFCKWIDQFNATTDIMNKYPRFAKFFQTKFSNIPYKKGYRTFNTTRTTGYILLNSKSLYAAIAFIWVPLIIGIHSYTMFLDVDDDDIRHILENNIEDLQKFMQTIQIVL